MKDINVEDCWVDFTLGENGVVGVNTINGYKWIAELPFGASVGRKDVELLLNRYKENGFCLNMRITKIILSENG